MFIILVINFQCLLGQKSFDAKADIILLNDYNIHLLNKSINGEYHDIHINLEQINDFDFDLQFENYGMITPKELLNTKLTLLKKENIDDNSFSYFKGKLISNPIYSYNKEREIIYELQFFNNIYLVLNSYHLKSNKWHLHDTNYVPFYILNLNSKKNIIILLEGPSSRYPNDIYGTIYSTNNELEGRIDGKLYSKDNSFTNLTGLKNTNFIKPLFEKQLYRVDEKHDLYDLYFNQKILKKFDSIKIKQPFIVAYAKSQISLFNLSLNNISKRNIKAIKYRGNNYAQILLKNKIKWINTNGSLVEKIDPIISIVCGTVCYAKREIKIENNIFKFSENVDCLDGDIIKTNLHLFSIKKYDDVFFLNGTKKHSFDGNTATDSYYKLPSNSLNYLIVKKEGKFGLLEIIFENNNMKLNTILPVTYDSIISLGYYLPILFNKNGLFGYFPINKSAKYKRIDEFNFYFSRFTLLNNKKGWLTLDGKEYLD